MRILIVGATGLVGKQLVTHLQAQADLTVVGRDAEKLRRHFGSLRAQAWSSLKDEDILLQDVIINLSGENVGTGRWTESKKQKIMDSRRDITGRLASVCATKGPQSPLLINASAMGIYGLSTPSAVYDEWSALPLKPTDFLAQVGSVWESALLPAEEAGVRVIKLRFSVVLSREGGVLKKLLPSFYLGMGARLGSGRQPFSWVSCSDAVRAIDFLLHSESAAGAYNIASGYLTTQDEFSRSLAAHLKRPYFFTMPSCVVRTLFGEMGDALLLNGIAVEPTRLREAGFEFEHKKLSDAWPALL